MELNALPHHGQHDRDRESARHVSITIVSKAHARQCIFWLLPSNVALQLQYNTIAKACVPKVNEGQSFFTRRNMAIAAAASTVSSAIVASSAYGVTLLQGIYAASFVLALMCTAMLPRLQTKKVLKFMAIMLVSVSGRAAPLSNPPNLLNRSPPSRAACWSAVLSRWR